MICTCKKVNKINSIKFPKYKIIKQNNNKPIFPLRCSHRGGCMEAAENTLKAFENSLRNNIKYLECDIHLTKD